MESDKEIKDILKEILKWVKFQGMQQVKQILETNLDTNIKKTVYELSDGKSSVEISRIAKVSDWTIRNYWKLWVPIQIVEIDSNYKGRYRKVFSLNEVGIPAPSYEGSSEEQENDSEEEK